MLNAECEIPIAKTMAKIDGEVDEVRRHDRRHRLSVTQLHGEQIPAKELRDLPALQSTRLLAVHEVDICARFGPHNG